MNKTWLSATLTQFKCSKDALAMSLYLSISKSMKQTPRRSDGFNNDNLPRLDRKKWKTAEMK